MRRASSMCVLTSAIQLFAGVSTCQAAENAGMPGEGSGAERQYNLVASGKLSGKRAKELYSLLCCADGSGGSNSPEEDKATSARDVDTKFKALVQDYLRHFMKSNPTSATDLGVHDYDGVLEDYSQKGVEEQTKVLKDLLLQAESLPYLSLSRDNQVDWNLIVGDMNARLLEYETVKNWKKDPDNYSSGVTRGIFALIQRDFAPLTDRLKSVIAREKSIPQALEDGKKNLDADLVPEIYTQIALEQLPGNIELFQSTVPDVFKSVDDQALKKEFDETNAACVAALKNYREFVESSLKGKSKGKFALGADLFAKKLLHEEFIDTPLDEVLAKGEAELHRLQDEFKALASKVDSTKSATEVFETIAVEHPEPDRLVSAVNNVLEEIRSYCKEKPIVKIPSEERARVEESPSFKRALSFASMDTPGPFEKKAREAFYYVTVPEKDWPAKRTEEHMRSFSDRDLLNTSVHEAYPGHYVQGLWINLSVSDARKVFGCMSNMEGWAHYCEQMMLDEGFHGKDDKLRLVQLHDALLRVCRYIVGIRMHTKGMTLEEGIRFFEKEGFQETANAEREAKRGTADPTYLVYTLGKLKIIDLRDEYQRMKDKDYSIAEFHEEFLKQGYPPLSMVRAQLLNLPVKKYFR
ncbi:MAG: DUF885 domain-containing protein [Cyanobacteria bacterium]|nr:DUF885 domain-containing protein [Cyanobacteriota bacterium]